MTRRERLERKLEKREQWGTKAHARSAQAYEGVRRIADGIPFGQPILVGHHSEQRARRDAERIRGGMDRSVAEGNLARHHESKAAGLAHQLERSIFDDDPDALDRLKEKISGLEANCQRMTQANKLWRKGGHPAVAGAFGATLAAAAAEVMAQGYSWIKSPFNLTSDRAEIRRCKTRIAAIEAQRVRAAQAEAAGGVTLAIATGVDWVTITFVQKPDRTVLEALKAAGFRWGNGSWHGYHSRLPAQVAELAHAGARECLCSDVDAYECTSCEAQRQEAEAGDDSVTP
jgi:hypothetical protein